MTAADRDDEGFTLVEMVIALLIMATAVITIVGALSSMFLLTSQHRGHAVVETTTRSFSQAIEAQGQFQTTLTAAVTSTSAGSVTVADASLLPPASDDSYVVIDREVMRITSVDRTADAGADSVSVTRGVTGSTAATHLAGATVTVFVRCSGSGGGGVTDELALFTPDASTYTATKGLVETVTAVSYWRPNPSSPGTGTFVDRDACESDFAARCTGGAVTPECMSGLVRVDVSTKSSVVAGNAEYDARFRNVDSTTSVLVRRGSQ